MASSDAGEKPNVTVDVNDTSTSSDCVGVSMHSDTRSRKRGRPVRGKSSVTTRPQTRGRSRAPAVDSNVIVSDSDDDKIHISQQQTSSPERANGALHLSRLPLPPSKNGRVSSISVRRSKRAAAALANAVLTSDEKLDRYLKKFLSQARNSHEADEILQKWRNASSRRTLLQHRKIVENSSSSESDFEDRENSTFKHVGSPAPSANGRGLGSDDESWQSTVSKDVRRPRRRSKTRLGNSMSKSRLTSLSKSVPLPKTSSLKERLKRRAEKSSNTPAFQSPFNGPKRKLAAESSRQKKRKRAVQRSRKSQKEVEDDDGDEIIDEGNGAISSESEMNFMADADEEEEGGREIGDKGESEEMEALKEESSDEDDDHEQSYLKSDKDESSYEEDNDTDDEVCEQPKRGRKLNRPVISSKRRKRTDPSNVFCEKKDELSASEQKARLEYLVSETARIASGLHRALAQSAIAKRASGADPSKPESNSILVKEETFVAPNGSGCVLQQHQTEGVKWLLTLDSQGLNAILADEMGLGKTIQAVAFLASLVISGSRGPHLVIAPKNVCDHWVQEIKRWYPDQLVVTTHLGVAEDRFEQLDATLEEDSFDIMITSYEIALRDLFSNTKPLGISPRHNAARRRLRKMEFEYLVVDEAHRLKNDNSRINQAIRHSSCARRRLLLTGTPLSNNLRELWSLMNILNPAIFSNKATFENWFSAPFNSAKEHKQVALTHAEKSVIVDRLHTIIRPFFRRRERKDVCPSYTSADEVIVHCPMSLLQKALMYHYQRRASEREAGVSNIVMAMREVSNHPFTLTDAFDEGDFDDFAVPKLVALSGKFSFLHYALPRLVASGHRILIFSQFRTVLDFLEHLMDILDMKFGRLDGMTNTEERTAGISDFNTSGSDIPVFLLTTRAGGVGLNLQTADTVILFDSDWNPSADLQAVSRIQRIGQKKTVHIMRLVSDDSIDALIVEVAEHKIKTQAVAVGAGKFHTSVGATQDQRIRQRDLEELLERLESKNFVETSGDSNVPDGLKCQALTPAKNKLCAEAASRLAEWDKRLLRSGESSLSAVDIEPIWIDSTADSGKTAIPKWLEKDADIVAASRAITCKDKAEALKVYEQVLMSRACIGTLKKQDRAARACRHVVYISDDSEDNGFQRKKKNGSDESVNMEDESSDSASLDNDVSYHDVRRNARSRNPSKVLNWSVSQAQDYRPDSQMPEKLTVENSNSCVRDISSSEIVESSHISNQVGFSTTRETGPNPEVPKDTANPCQTNPMANIESYSLINVKSVFDGGDRLNKGNVSGFHQPVVATSSRDLLGKEHVSDHAGKHDLSDSHVDESLSSKASPEPSRSLNESASHSVEKNNSLPFSADKAIRHASYGANSIPAPKCVHANPVNVDFLAHPRPYPVPTPLYCQSLQHLSPMQNPSPHGLKRVSNNQRATTLKSRPSPIKSLHETQPISNVKHSDDKMSPATRKRILRLPLMQASGSMSVMELLAPFDGALYDRASRLSEEAMEFARIGNINGIRERCSQLSAEIKEWEEKARQELTNVCRAPPLEMMERIRPPSTKPIQLPPGYEILQVPKSNGCDGYFPVPIDRRLYAPQRAVPSSPSIPNTVVSKDAHHATPRLNTRSSQSGLNHTSLSYGQNYESPKTIGSSNSQYVPSVTSNLAAFESLGTSKRNTFSATNGRTNFDQQQTHPVSSSPGGLGSLGAMKMSHEISGNYSCSAPNKMIKTAQNNAVSKRPVVLKAKIPNIDHPIATPGAKLSETINGNAQISQSPGFYQKSSENVNFRSNPIVASSSLPQNGLSASQNSRNPCLVSLSESRWLAAAQQPPTGKPIMKANVSEVEKSGYGLERKVVQSKISFMSEMVKRGRPQSGEFSEKHVYPFDADSVEVVEIDEDEKVQKSSTMKKPVAIASPYNSNPYSLGKYSAIAKPPISDQGTPNRIVSEEEVIAAVTSSGRSKELTSKSNHLATPTKTLSVDRPCSGDVLPLKSGFGLKRPVLSFEYADPNAKISKTPVTPKYLSRPGSAVAFKMKRAECVEVTDLTSPEPTKYTGSHILKTSNSQTPTAGVDPVEELSLKGTGERDVEARPVVRTPCGNDIKAKAEAEDRVCATRSLELSGKANDLNIVHNVIALNIVCQCSEPFCGIDQFCKKCGPCIHVQRRPIECEVMKEKIKNGEKQR